MGTVVPEIVGVGVDPDGDPFNGNGALFQLGGTQRHGSFADLRGAGEAGRFAIEAAEVAFAETIELDGAADGLFGLGSITMSPNGQHRYATTLTGSLERFAVNADGSLGAREAIQLTNPGYFQTPEALALDNGGIQVGEGRGIIGIAFDPSDPDTI